MASLGGIFPEYLRNYPVSNAIVEILEEIVFSDRQEIAKMLDIFDLDNMPIDFIMKWAGFYGFDSSFFSAKSSSASASAIKRMRFLLKNRGTIGSLESICRTKGTLFSDEIIDVHAYHGYEVPKAISGQKGGMDGVIYIVTNDADVNFNTSFVNSVIPAGYRIETSAQTEYSIAYDRWVYDAAEHNKGRYEKVPVYSPHGIVVVDGVPEKGFTDVHDPLFGITERDKRKTEWVVYGDSRIAYRAFNTNSPSPRPYAKKVEGSDLPGGGSLPVGYGDIPPFSDAIARFSDATFPNHGESFEEEWKENATRWIEVLEGNKTRPFNDVEFYEPVIAGNGRETYIQDIEQVKTQNEITESFWMDIEPPLDTDHLVMDAQYNTVIHDPMNGNIYSNKYAFVSGLKNSDLYEIRNKRCSSVKNEDYWHTCYYGSYQKNMKEQRYPETASQPKYIYDYGRAPRKINPGDTYYIGYADESFLSREMGHLGNEVARDETTGEYTEYSEREQNYIDEKGMKFVEEFAGFSSLNYEIGLFDSIEIEEDAVPISRAIFAQGYNDGLSVSVIDAVVPSGKIYMKDSSEFKENTWDVVSSIKEIPSTVEGKHDVYSIFYENLGDEFTALVDSDVPDEGIQRLCFGAKGVGGYIDKDWIDRNEQSIGYEFSVRTVTEVSSGGKKYEIKLKKYVSEYSQLHLCEFIYDGNEYDKSMLFTNVIAMHS